MTLDQETKRAFIPSSLPDLSTKQAELIYNCRSRMNDLTLASSLIPGVWDAVGGSENAFFLVNDALYVHLNSRPFHKREIVLLSAKKVYPGIRIEHIINTKQKTSYYISLITNIASSTVGKLDVNNFDKPSWWPSNYDGFDVRGLALPNDLVSVHLGQPRMFLDNTKPFRELEFPEDADFAYLWERNKIEVKDFVEEIKKRL